MLRLTPFGLLKGFVLESLNDEALLRPESIRDAVDVLIRQIAEILARNPNTVQITGSQRQCKMIQPNVFLRLTQINEHVLADGIPHMIVEITLSDKKIAILASDFDLGMRNEFKDSEGCLPFSFFTISNKGDNSYLDNSHGFTFYGGDINKFSFFFYSKIASQNSIIIAARVLRELIPFLDTCYERLDSCQ